MKTSGYDRHNQSCLRNSRRFVRRWGTRPSRVKTYSFVNGLHVSNLPVHERVSYVMLSYFCPACTLTVSFIVIYYNNAGILCVCVCLFVCLSHLRPRERDVIAPRFLHWREELCLANCTNRFSSRYDAPFETKRHWKFFRGYALTAVYPCKNFRLQWARSVLPMKF